MTQLSLSYSASWTALQLTAQTGPNGATASMQRAEGAVQVGVAVSDDGAPLAAPGGQAGAAASDTTADDLLAKAAAAREIREAATESTRADWRDRVRARRIGGMRGRMMQMVRALERLQGQGPGQGATTAFGWTRAGASDAVSVTTDGVVSGLRTGGGSDSVSISAAAVQGLRTGPGADAVTIAADVVLGVSTDPRGRRHRHGAGGSADALAISAKYAGAIRTGGGDDAVAIAADVIDGVKTGRGADAVTLAGGSVSGIRTGGGADVVTIDAVIGGPDRAITDGVYTGYTRGDTAEARMQAAMTGFADVSLGRGDDVLTLNLSEVISVDAGRGDDQMVLGGGTVALTFDAGDGQDTVLIEPGAEVVVALGEHVTDWSVSEDAGALVLTTNDGSIRFEGAALAGGIGVSAFGNDAVELVQMAEPLDLTV